MLQPERARLALAAAAAGLAVAAAFAAADALLPVDGAGDVLQFVKFHGISGWGRHGRRWAARTGLV